jgi:hypothetical protein
MFDSSQVINLSDKGNQETPLVLWKIKEQIFPFFQEAVLICNIQFIR